MRELILGGQKSGKSRMAEERASAWLSQSISHKAVLIATGLAHDEEMQGRITRHQADRLIRLPAMHCVEEPREIASALLAHSNAQTLVVVDCITMWLTNLLMPVFNGLLEEKGELAGTNTARSAMDLIVSLPSDLSAATGPVVLVSNEIGLGVIPLGREVRHFVDELGKLNQALAARCARVTLMAAGCALPIKEPS